MTTQVKQGNKMMVAGSHQEMQEEMVGVLTAISIVSKRLANRLIQLNEENGKGEKEHEQNETRA
ncbi:hypothetical protein [Schinkia azotoformans]|uniref:hypothetical protein n=1 Tax=Schinkia azotoformans TaxID=1454 RepID=UPI002DB938A9|nr:hypothetical protein [Schinkia azotoformans]MEC1719099.1 hypothetical protein [Schinkia azotoformans]MED4413853.1 hypothetical protein [Schinkia azotoformans]